MDPATHEEWNRRLRGLLAVVALLFAILFVRLFQLQITAFADYRRESEENRIAQKRIKAPRGHILDRKGRILARNRASYTIFLLRSTAHRDSLAVSALEEAIGESISYARRRPAIRLVRDVDFETVCIVEERLRDDWLLDIEIEPRRDYPFGSTTAHVIGYMGEMQEGDLDGRGARHYEPGDYIGKTGIEKVFEDRLRGKDGVRYIEVDAKHRTLKDESPFPERDHSPILGGDVTLTLDVDVQRAAERALPDTLAGSVVALDAQTGAVLAMVSKPSFDPNVFVSYQDQEEREAFLRSATEPLLNRSIQGRYPPGSTLKMVAAVAALEAGITDTLSTFEACAGSLAVGDVVMRCFNREGHGELNLLEAIEASCNIYFIHLAQILGIEAWRESGEVFGFGEASGIVLDREEVGLLPSREYYARKEGWVAGHLMNLVIGQGAMLVTPLQMARYVAALGNGGRLVTPHLYGSPPDALQLQISEKNLDIVRKGMYRVVNGDEGTGRRARLSEVAVAGKSGTAQVPNRNNDDAWFVAFAPFEEPEIAVAVVVEAGGAGGGTAAPVARRVLKAYFDSRPAKPAVDLRDTRPASLSGPATTEATRRLAATEKAGT